MSDVLRIDRAAAERRVPEIQKQLGFPASVCRIKALWEQVDSALHRARSAGMDERRAAAEINQSDADAWAAYLDWSARIARLHAMQRQDEDRKIAAPYTAAIRRLRAEGVTGSRVFSLAAQEAGDDAHRAWVASGCPEC